MFWVVILNPTSRAVSLSLKVHEVARSTTHVTGDTVPEAVKLRHNPRYPLEQPAYEVDSLILTCRRVRCVSGKHPL